MSMPTDRVCVGEEKNPMGWDFGCATKTALKRPLESKFVVLLQQEPPWSGTGIWAPFLERPLPPTEVASPMTGGGWKKHYSIWQLKNKTTQFDTKDNPCKESPMPVTLKPFKSSGGMKRA